MRSLAACSASLRFGERRCLAGRAVLVRIRVAEPAVVDSLATFILPTAYPGRARIQVRRLTDAIEFGGEDDTRGSGAVVGVAEQPVGRYSGYLLFSSERDELVRD